MLRLFVIWVFQYAAHTWSRFGHSWYILSSHTSRLWWSTKLFAVLI